MLVLNICLIINIFQVYFESYNHCCGSHQNASLRSSTGGSLMDWKPQSCCTLISVPSLPQRLCFSHVAPSQGLIWRGILWLLHFGLRIPWPSCQTLLGYIFVYVASTQPSSLSFLTSVAPIKSITQLILSWS